MPARSLTHPIHQILIGSLMKTFTPTITSPIGIATKSLTPLMISNPKTNKFTYKKSTKQLAFPPALKTSNLTEKDLNTANLRQQLLILQELWLEKDKDSIVQAMLEKDRAIIIFLHWLAVPSLGVIFSFSHQTCCQIEWL